MKHYSKFYFVSFMMSLMCFILLCVLVFFMGVSSDIMMEIEILSLNSLHIFYIIYVDFFSILFSLVVLLISSLVLIYSKEYLGIECMKFMWMTVFFIMFMIIMIYSPSILGVILGWDGLGIVSYSLVIYYQSKYSFNSGFITAASNRLGDTMLIISIIWCLLSGGYWLTWEFIDKFSLFFFMSACLTKSAQFPFNAWLPLAMAAPTPISSLVHSSTLVTAGVYMLIRFYFMIEMSGLNMLLLMSSMVTIFIAGMSCVCEMDMKKVIALSTLGQLGFMMVILSLGEVLVSFFHLLVHALFKALLFMCSGVIIHAGGGVQDLRKMGFMNISLIIKISLNISSFNLLGVPFTSGFYSKDLIFELAYCSNSGMGVGVFMLFNIFVTSVYSMRMLFYLTKSNYWLIWNEPFSNMCYSVYILSLCNILISMVLNWTVMGNIMMTYLPLIFKIGPVFMIIMGLIFQGSLINKKSLIFMFSSLMFISSLSKMLSMKIVYMFFMMKMLDQGLLESIMLMNKNLIILLSSWTKKYFEMNFPMLGILIIVAMGLLIIL
uniref:NADH:ubiquinone reductase (H(+)-translocating) n=1 Tax=Melanastera paucipunctata TaxID=2218046 RepID=A0A344A299_9HEMI|nr:NADH dehydrogenase subunit 5 [Diclidophlebia paucipunctata]AWU48890.1 NADH dehydrogenase subunit 5 [Diclidophlebia paucipunctata]